MKSLFVITLVLFSCLCLVGVNQAVAVSKEGSQDEDESVAEITRSFSTLELIAKNPSMMSKIQLPDSLETDFELRESVKTRRRRQVDSPSTLPTSVPPSGAEQPSLGQNPFGPYSWPMYSGQCFLCPAGVPGEKGCQGPQGVAGRDGRDGRDAPTGPQAQETPTPPSDGVIYIRWGNDVCPEDAELIYSGTIGGAHYTHSGSGSNYLCMPDTPIYDEVETSLHNERARLYSSE
ncbi:uncharacterized protein LOC105442867 [Strongylocentrotus purpuratus]|uniref:Uncharacterized protein n=1 Tax=Strongylocentrotus purpuratus TaxID=7668 RepID=A0A7M7P958_STRPU|nr:uncharacterized protein LOC105442867 [Strongylocentrotus purpuratus]